MTSDALNFPKQTRGGGDMPRCSKADQQTLKAQKTHSVGRSFARKDSKFVAQTLTVSLHYIRWGFFRLKWGRETNVMARDTKNR